MSLNPQNMCTQSNGGEHIYISEPTMDNWGREGVANVCQLCGEKNGWHQISDGTDDY